MKKIDRLLIQNFIPPFIVTFFIALFVLIMIFLWTYIDDIIGKAAGFWILVELLSYMSISQIPLALPIAVLISSVMVMGNLAERYELASMKSAGIPLSRIMKPLMFMTAGIAVFSFFCSNYIMPWANLQFKSRLYDIRKQKPALNLEAGVFNDDFRGFIIHIGKKNSNNRDIEDIIIYDHSSGSKDPMQIVARKGEMYVTNNGLYFIMKLYDGTQYQETRQTTKGKSKTYPFARTSFKEWNKVFDLSEFSIDRTDTELFDSHYSMLSVAQLGVKIDSLNNKIEAKLLKMEEYTNQYIGIFYKDTTQHKKVPDQKEMVFDTSGISVPENIDSSSILSSIKLDSIKKQNRAQPRAKIQSRAPLEQTITKPLAEYASIAEIFPKDKVKRNLISKAQSYARNLQSQSKSTLRALDKYKEGLVKHIFERNMKFSMATVCFIFLFIGAPMGAIVRKGGFGYPILIAIAFFIFYIILNVLFKKLAESMVIHAFLAAWMPCIILFPIGWILTNRAMNDSKLLDVDKYFLAIRKLLLGKSNITD